MSIASDFQKRLRGIGGLATVATLTVASVALASHAVKGASYIGSYSDGETNAISFKVSPSGKKVLDLTVQTPITCQGGCGGIGSGSPASAKISKKGAFKVTLNLDFPPGSNKSEGTETVTGKFLEQGFATGTVSSHFKGGTSSNRTVHWTAAPATTG